jgi:predicted ribosomally synthesized peptide with SipW-like signal peptide
MFKNRKKLVIALTASALCITSVVGGTLAYFTDKDIRSNVVTLGHVTGTLTETDEHKRDDNTTGKDYSNVKPGDVLSKDPTVNLKSDSEDAYVRVRIDYKGLTDEQAADIEEALDIQKGWVKSDDGYYYYQNILSNKNDGETSSKVFTKVTIPAEWGNEMADKTFNIDARAEFIQADNFTPVKDAYGNITGWGNADIK